mgnify:CR=1 FL=1
MKTSATLFFAFLAATPMLWPLSDFATQGYTSLWGCVVLLLSISAVTGILYYMCALPRAIKRDLKYDAELRKEIRALRKKLVDEPDEPTDSDAWVSMKKFKRAGLSYKLNRLLQRDQRKNSAQDTVKSSATGLSILCFILLFVTSAIWFDTVPSSHRLYDQSTQQIVDNNSLRIYFWEMPKNLRQISWRATKGSFSDTRPYQHHATGQIVGYNTQTWESTFELNYTVPDSTLRRDFQNGRIPNYEAKMRVVFRDSVDLMYYKGLGNFPTTSDLQNTLKEEVRSRCAAAFGAESCPVNFRVNVPHFPRRGAVNPGPGDNST